MQVDRRRTRQREKVKTLGKRQELFFFFLQMTRDGRDGGEKLNARTGEGAGRGGDDERGRRPSGDQNTSARTAARRCLSYPRTLLPERPRGVGIRAV